MSLPSGASTAASSPPDVASRNPTTGEVWATFAPASAHEVQSVIQRARAAQPAWDALGVDGRAKILGNVARLIFERRLEIASVIARENGKPEVEALATEVVTTLDMLRFNIRHASHALGDSTSGSTSLALWRKRITITREAFGVVGVISPWNYPFMLPAGIVAPVLIAGNSVVLKPSELTPSSSALLRELFLASGVPAEVFQVVQGRGDVGSALVQGEIDKVFFTGSVNTGRRVAHACAERLVPCVLELGGSDPALVLADADVDHAASGILWGRFSNCGQTCIAPKRVFVARERYDAFVDALSKRVAQLRIIGSNITSDDDLGYDMGYDMGALIRESQRELLDALYADAVARGAQSVSVHAPPANSAAHAALGGRWSAPTLLTNLPPDARALHEETFGPLLPIVAVDSEEEMVARANASDFGLSASVWSRDRRRAKALARRLHAGTVVINDVALVAGIAEVPHGGVKHSGSGRAHGIAGLEECVRTKTIVDDVITSWRQPWWFGYGQDALKRMDGYSRLAHGRTLWERISGITSTLALLFRPERPL